MAIVLESFPLTSPLHLWPSPLTLRCLHAIRAPALTLVPGDRQGPRQSAPCRQHCEQGQFLEAQSSLSLTWGQEAHPLAQELSTDPCPSRRAVARLSSCWLCMVHALRSKRGMHQKRHFFHPAGYCELTHSSSLWWFAPASKSRTGHFLPCRWGCLQEHYIQLSYMYTAHGVYWGVFSCLYLIPAPLVSFHRAHVWLL